MDTHTVFLIFIKKFFLNLVVLFVVILFSRNQRALKKLMPGALALAVCENCHVLSNKAQRIQQNNMLYCSTCRQRIALLSSDPSQERILHKRRNEKNSSNHSESQIIKFLRSTGNSCVSVRLSSDEIIRITHCAVNGSDILVKFDNNAQVRLPLITGRDAEKVIILQVLTASPLEDSAGIPLRLESATSVVPKPQQANVQQANVDYTSQMMRLLEEDPCEGVIKKYDPQGRTMKRIDEQCDFEAEHQHKRRNYVQEKMDAHRLTAQDEDTVSIRSSTPTPSDK